MTPKHGLCSAELRLLSFILCQNIRLYKIRNRNGFKVEKGGGRFREIMGKEKIENLNWWFIINTRIEIVLKNIAAMTQNIFVFSFFAFN